MPVNSPNMGLPIPVVSVDPGPQWAEYYNAALTIVDQHNHSPGSGVAISPNGLNINADLSFQNNNAIVLRSTRFTIQASPISGASDLVCLYSGNASGDMYWNDGAGNQIQITSGGTVNATSSGISSGTASASFSGGVLVVNQAANTPGNIQCGSVLIGNNVANSKFSTLSAPGSLAANQTITLPVVPSAQSFLTMDTSGSIANYASISAGISRTNIATMGYAKSSSSGAYSTSSTTPVQPTNLSVSVTTVGGPVLLILQSDGTGSAFGPNVASATLATGFVYLYRGATKIFEQELAAYYAALCSGPVCLDASVIGSPGTYTYSCKVQATVGGGTFYVESMVLVAREML